MRAFTAGLAALSVFAVLAGGREVARGKEVPPALRVSESLSQRLEFSRRGDGPGVALRETRRLLASATLPFDGGPRVAFDADTPLGIRIGDWIFEGRLGDDRQWRPRRWRARLLDRSGEGDAERSVRVSASWTDSHLALRVEARGVAPLAAGLRTGPEGAVGAAVDAAVRIGPHGWRIGGTEAGTLEGTAADVLGSPLRLVRIALDGEGRLLDETEDGDAPSVSILAPAPDALLEEGLLSVTGVLGDHRTLDGVTYSLNGGPATPVAYETDPESGYLTDLAGVFEFPVDPVPGRNRLEVTVRDLAGNEATSAVDFAVVVPRAIPLASGGNHALATDASGGVRTWGAGPALSSTTPAVLPGLEGAVALAAGMSHDLALMEDGTVRSWGSNGYGQLGFPTTPQGTYVAQPTTVPGLEGIVAIAARDLNSMALRADGTVFAWGANGYGAVGDGSTDPFRTVPVPVPGLPPIRAIALGSGIRPDWSTAYAVAEDGTVWAWGDDALGQLCRGNVTPRLSRVPVRNAYVTGAVAVESGWGFAVALREDGTVWGWGRDTNGQIQSGTWNGSHLLPRTFPGISGIAAVACGTDFTLLLREDGTVLACGNNNYGQLGNGTTTTVAYPSAQAPPAAIPGLADVRSLAAGWASGYAVREDGSLWTWGRNASGMLGDGTTADRWSPVLVLLDL